jgi:kanamycin kinase
VLNLAGPPEGPVELPEVLSSRAYGEVLNVVWQNELGGLTARVLGERGELYVKWVPATSGLDIAGEVERIGWAKGFTPVVDVIDSGADQRGAWMVSLSIDAENLVAPRWRAEPRRAAASLGEGLRALHDALPVASCPFTWSRESRLAEIEERLARGELEGHALGHELAEVGVAQALAELADAPDADPVVCHGDACAPNTLVASDGRWVAHVDLGRLGVGDRFSDIAVATWSTVWNYGPGFEEIVLAGYGIDPDPALTRYYRLLWELG